MSVTHRQLAFLLTTVFLAASVASAQQEPHIGYLYPAGGQLGTTFEITIGGQFLDGADRVFFSGDAVAAKVLEHVKPLSQQQVNTLRQKLQEVQKKILTERKDRRFGQIRPGNVAAFAKVAQEYGISAEELKALNDYRVRLQDPKRQLNPQIAETVTLEVTVAADAEPSRCELRLATARGLSNPMNFAIGHSAEYREQEPNDTTPDAGIGDSLPVVVNGQIMPGDVDRFSFRASRGQSLVVAVAARELIPYLADAVPGWFQATVALCDASGKEVAYADDFRFHPDPAMVYEIPADGEYVLEIKDAMYRGREDFVYRITMGELPFVTSVFPLGGCAGEPVTVELNGWNLPSDQLELDDHRRAPGVHWINVGKPPAVNQVLFAVDTLPQHYEVEPNDHSAEAQVVTLPLIVNGRIDRPGDWDIFRIKAHEGDEIVAEVHARRLNSPLDSLLTLTDAQGQRVAVNDDHVDQGAALTTHQADSLLSLTIPADGVYELHLGDTQGQGGAAYAYRLRISPPQPDFELRVTPASINVQAGATVPIDVYALRRDGFSGDILLGLDDVPNGFTLSGRTIPAGRDHIRLTLTAPAFAREQPIRFGLAGLAEIGGRAVRRTAIPADNMMQAFAYQHLVPAEVGLVSVVGRSRVRAPLRLVGDLPVKLPVGGTARVQFAIGPNPQLDQIQLALNDSPPGISIQDKSTVDDGIVILLNAADDAQSGLKGNLIVDAFIERAIPGTGNRRRFPIGTLPAVPFEIVQP